MKIQKENFIANNTIKDIQDIFNNDYTQKLIEMDNYTELYNDYRKPLILVSSITQVLLEAGINPLLYMIFVPEGFCYLNYDLKSISIPNTIEQIYFKSFYMCTSLKNVKIGNKVESIGDISFYGCSSLEDIILPDSLLNIGYSAFYGCNNLKSITLSPNIENIDNDAFIKCEKLSDIYFKGTKEQWAKIHLNNNKFKNVNIHFIK